MIQRIITIWLKPEQKKLNDINNPPSLVVEFFSEQKNIKNINCYSNDGGNWKKSNLKFENQSLIINFEKPFVPRDFRCAFEKALKRSGIDDFKFHDLEAHCNIRPRLYGSPYS